MRAQNINKYSEERPWGRFERFTLNEISTIKILTINPNEETSLQKHKKRDEFWRILSGKGLVLIGDGKLEAVSGGEFNIPRETAHQIIGGNEPLVVLEISLGNFDENDEERLGDKYNRFSPQ